MAGKITALKVQKRNKERVNVYVDGEFAFGLAMIESLNLKIGQRLTDEDIAELEALDEIETVHQHALNILSYRPRSEEELRRKLQRSKKQYSAVAIETVIERLSRVSLLDDEAFARYWVENRERFKPRSARALRYELQRKGVSDQAIERAIADLDETDSAYRAAESRARRYASKDEQTFRKKLSDYLARRGFSYGIIRDVVDRLWSEQSVQ